MTAHILLEQTYFSNVGIAFVEEDDLEVFAGVDRARLLVDAVVAVGKGYGDIGYACVSYVAKNGNGKWYQGFACGDLGCRRVLYWPL